MTAKPAANKIQRPAWTLPIIVFSQFAGTSIWFSGNAVLAELTRAGSQSTSMVGWVTGAVQLGFILGTLLVAVSGIADRFSPRLVFLVCAIAGAAANLCTTLVDAAPAGLLIFRFLCGMFLAGIYPVGMKIAAGWYARGLGNALGFLIGALVLGTAFPHLLRGVLAAVPWQAVIYLSSGVCLAGGLAMAVFIPDGPYLAGVSRFDPRAVMTIFRHRPLRAAALGYFGHMWELYTLWAFVPVLLGAFVSDRAGHALDVSFWSFIVIGSGSIGCIIGGRASRRMGSATVASVQLAVSGGCCLAAPWLFDAPPWVFLAFMLVWGMTVVGDSPQFSTIVARTAPPERVGSALTLVNCIGFSITVVSLWLTQWLAAGIPIQYMPLALAAGPAIGLIAMRPLTMSER
jgi:MFS family permease